MGRRGTALVVAAGTALLAQCRAESCHGGAALACNIVEHDTDQASALQVVAKPRLGLNGECACDLVDATAEIFVRDWWGDLEAPLQLTFNGGGCTFTIESEDSPRNSTAPRVVHTAFPKCILDDFGYMSLQLRHPCKWFEERVAPTCIQSDIWVQAVHLTAPGMPTVLLPYSGWAGSIQASAILPLLPDGQTAQAIQGSVGEGPGIQLSIGRQLYQWGNWESLNLPFNMWSPHMALIGIQDYILSFGNLGYDMQSNSVVLPQQKESVNFHKLNLSAVVLPKQVKRGLEWLSSGKHAPVLPLNEIMQTPKAFHDDLVRLAHGALNGLVAEGGHAIQTGVSDLAADFARATQDVWEDVFLNRTGIKAVQTALRIFGRLVEKRKPATPAPTASPNELPYVEPLTPGGAFEGLQAPGMFQMPTEEGFPGIFPTSEKWNEDWFLGQQMLQGVAPTMLTRVVGELPGKLAVTDAVLGASDPSGGLLGGLTIAQAIAAKLLFLVDLEIIDGIQWFQGGGLLSVKGVNATPDATTADLKPRYACAPIGLFFLDTTSESLLPVAMQLGQTPGDAPVYTPRDSLPEWTVAKMFFQCALGNIHQLSTHALRTHLVTEPWAVAIQRSLPSSHPVFKLIYPHMRYTMQINMMARSSLIAPGTVFDAFIASGASAKQWEESPLFSNSSDASWSAVGYVDFFQKAYAVWSVETSNFAQAVAKRGVDKEDLPIDYPYRDDGGLVWDALHSLVREMLGLAYADDAAVQSDPYLQALAEDIRFGLGNKWAGAEIENGIPPDAFSTLDKVSETIASALWGSGYQHSAVNYLQYDYYGFVPNMPLAMYKPVPARGQGPKTMEEVVEYLPDYFTAAQQIGVTYLLSTYYDDQVYLDQVDRTYSQWYAGEKEKAVLERYKQNLSSIESIVTERNRKRRVYYQQFLPSKCPISITV